ELPGGLQAWVVTRHAEATQLYGHPGLTRDWRTLERPACDFGRQRYPEDHFAVSGKQLFNTVGADHTRLRRIIMPYLTRRRVEMWRPTVVELVNAAFDRLSGREEADFVTDFALPVTSAVVGEILGLPEQPRAEMTKLMEVSTAQLDPSSVEWSRAAHEQ